MQWHQFILSLRFSLRALIKDNRHASVQKYLNNIINFFKYLYKNKKNQYGGYINKRISIVIEQINV